jgi:hypothetical protein
MLTVTFNSSLSKQSDRTVQRLKRYKRFLENQFLEGMLK